MFVCILTFSFSSSSSSKDTTSEASRERPGSRSGSERSKESEDPSLRSGQYGISRFADLAGEQMRRLRRNWSTTKTDITQTITRIKKKSTASVVDLSEVFKMGGVPQAAREDSSPEKEVASPPPQTRSNKRAGDQKKKGTWALRQIRRRMTVAPSTNAMGKNKEPSTFYLTLTIEQGQSATKSDSSKSSSFSETSSPEPAGSTPSPVPPLVSPSTASSTPTSSVSKVPVQPKRTSSASSLQYQATVRPKTAPPDPPVRSQSVPATQAPIALSAPAVTTKRPLTRLPYSESRLAADKSLIGIECNQPTQYCDIAINPSVRRKSTTGSETPCSNTPYSRLSLASNGTYMSLGEVASSSHSSTAPQSRPDEMQSYLDLQPPLESEELYMSSHFADEPLYQFYTAAIIEVRSNCNCQSATLKGNDSNMPVGCGFR